MFKIILVASSCNYEADKGVLRSNLRNEMKKKKRGGISHHEVEPNNLIELELVSALSDAFE